MSSCKGEIQVQFTKLFVQAPLLPMLQCLGFWLRNLKISDSYCDCAHYLLTQSASYICFMYLCFEIPNASQFNTIFSQTPSNIKHVLRQVYSTGQYGKIIARTENRPVAPNAVNGGTWKDSASTARQPHLLFCAMSNTWHTSC